jgi:hypothetical protein
MVLSSPDEADGLVGQSNNRVLAERSPFVKVIAEKSIYQALQAR